MTPGAPLAEPAARRRSTPCRCVSARCSSSRPSGRPARAGRRGCGGSRRRSCARSRCLALLLIPLHRVRGRADDAVPVEPAGRVRARIRASTARRTTCTRRSCSRASPWCSRSGWCSRGRSGARRSRRTRAPTARCPLIIASTVWAPRSSSCSRCTITLAAYDWLASLDPGWSARCSRSTCSRAPSCRGIAAVTLATVAVSMRRQPLARRRRRTAAARPRQDAVRVLDLLGLHLDLPVPADLVRQHPRGGDALPDAHERGLAAAVRAERRAQLGGPVPGTDVRRREAKPAPAGARSPPWCSLGHWLDLYLVIMPSVWREPRLGLPELALALPYAALLIFLFRRQLARAAAGPGARADVAARGSAAQGDRMKDAQAARDAGRRRRRGRVRVAARRPGDRSAEPDPRGGALRHRRGAGAARRPTRSTGQAQNHPGQCQNCHQQDLRRVERLDDVELVARPGVARRLPAARARGVDQRRVRHARSRPTARRKAQPQPVRAAPDSARRRSTSAPARSRVSRPGSLLDAFCSRCHMPTNYVDNVPLAQREARRRRPGSRRALVDPKFNPTSDNGTGVAFATARRAVPQHRVGQGRHLLRRLPQLRGDARHPVPQLPQGAATRTRPRSAATRAQLVQPGAVDVLAVADPTRPQPRLRDRRRRRTGCRRTRSRSPNASGRCCAGAPPRGDDANTSSVFGHPVAVPAARRVQAQGLRQRALRAGRDVRRLPRRHQRAADQEPARGAGWAASRSSARTRSGWTAATPTGPATPTSIPRFKRDCQSCHMQQDYGQPGTAQTLYRDGKPLPHPQRADRHRRQAAAVVHASLRGRQRVRAAA